MPVAGSKKEIRYSKARIPTGHHHQEHGEHLAVAQIQLNAAFHHSRQDGGDSAVKQASREAGTGRQGLQPAPEIHQDLNQHPQQDQHGGDAAFGGVVEINIVQVPIPTRGQRAGNIGRHVFVEVQLRAFGSEPEPGMALDHAQAGAPGDNAELIGIVDLRLEDRHDAVPEMASGETKNATDNATGARATIQRRQIKTR